MEHDTINTTTTDFEEWHQNDQPINCIGSYTCTHTAFTIGVFQQYSTNSSNRKVSYFDKGFFWCGPMFFFNQ